MDSQVIAKVAEQRSCVMPGDRQRLTTAGCGFSLNEAAIEKLSAIQATGNNLRVTQTMQFKTEAPVIWSVNGIPGGNADIGTISSTGLYTAPAIVPLPNNQVTIGSSAEIYPSKGNYGVSVLNPIPIVTTITPGRIFRGNGADRGERIGLCLRRANPVEWRGGSDNLYVRHATGCRHHGKYSGHLSGDGGQS